MFDYVFRKVTPHCTVLETTTTHLCVM